MFLQATTLSMAKEHLISNCNNYLSRSLTFFPLPLTSYSLLPLFYIVCVFYGIYSTIYFLKNVVYHIF